MVRLVLATEKFSLQKPNGPLRLAEWHFFCFCYIGSLLFPEANGNLVIKEVSKVETFLLCLSHIPMRLSVLPKSLLLSPPSLVFPISTIIIPPPPKLLSNVLMSFFLLLHPSFPP